MIPAIERMIVEALERRISEALPELDTNKNGAPEQITSHIEKRTCKRNVQEQSGLKLFGKVEALLSVEFYTNGQEFVDKTPLIASFMENPYLTIDGDRHPLCEIEGSEIADGPHLDTDVFVFKVTYEIYDRLDGRVYQSPRLGNIDTDAPDIYPRPTWDGRNEPESVV